MPQATHSSSLQSCLISYTLPQTFINICWHYCVYATTKQLESAWVVDPFLKGLALGLGFLLSLWVVGFCGSEIWPCLLISSSLLPPFVFSLFFSLYFTQFTLRNYHSLTLGPKTKTLYLIISHSHFVFIYTLTPSID